MIVFLRAKRAFLNLYFGTENETEVTVGLFFQLHSLLDLTTLIFSPHILISNLFSICSYIRHKGQNMSDTELVYLKVNQGQI